MSIVSISVPTEDILTALERRGVSVGEIRAKLTSTTKDYQKHPNHLDINTYSKQGIYVTRVEEDQL